MNGSVKKDSMAVPSKSYQNLTTSALTGVFGSQVSLAELNGDVSMTPSRSHTPSGRSPGGVRSKGPGGLAAELTRKLESQNKSPAPPRRGHTKTKSTVPSIAGGSVPLSATTLVSRLALLFMFGVAYGQLSKRLHDNHQVTSYTLDIDHTGAFSLVWGSQGILLGFLLPLFDWMFPEERKRLRGKGGEDWASIVRAAVAFLGVAYGIRKFAWSSTLQAAMYWAALNPCLWYILDATRNGFILSTLTGIVGTFVFALIFPDHLPDRSLGIDEVYFSVVLVVASVFFCCSICFGNLGRRLLSFQQLTS